MCFNMKSTRKIWNSKNILEICFVPIQLWKKLLIQNRTIWIQVSRLSSKLPLFFTWSIEPQFANFSKSSVCSTIKNTCLHYGKFPDCFEPRRMLSRNTLTDKPIYWFSWLKDKHPWRCEFWHIKEETFTIFQSVFVWISDIQ